MAGPFPGAILLAALGSLEPGDTVKLILHTERTLDLGGGVQTVRAGETVTFTIRETVEVEGLPADG